jgi:ATP-dependent RNA helicase RhlE
MQGKDILGLASTGSGKTAAFLLPMINKFIKDGTQTCLIVVPTRELGSQIQDEFRELAKGTNLKSVLIIGGKSIRDQMYILSKRPHFIIATPGRLKDIYDRRGVNLGEVNNVILDEVDRMLDMGFIDDIRYIIDKLDTNRQSLFFSATMSFKAEAIANSLLKNPIKIEIEQQSAQKNVDQDIIRVDGSKRKEEVLLDLLSKEEFKRVLIFTRTKRNADKLSDYLYNQKLNVDALHGDKRQSQRTRIIDGFKRGDFNILIATDVASRGLDVNNITHVINYDEPESMEDYIHRIGRTGRAGKKGYALTFVDRS